MIFLTVGTHTKGFDRLVRAADQWAKDIGEPVLMQIGSSTFEPAHAQWFRWAPPEKIDEFMTQARVVVSHAGAGSLLAALRLGRPVVAVPRSMALSEHIDDHQLELCEALEAAGLVEIGYPPAHPKALTGAVSRPRGRDESGSINDAIATILDEWQRR